MTSRQANILSALVGFWVFFVLAMLGKQLLPALPLADVMSNEVMLWYFGTLLVSSIAFVLWVLFFRGEREFRS